jgi:hypothetical protein
MFKNHIKDVLLLNKVDLINVEGNRLFYSRTKNIISSIFWLIMLFPPLYLFVNQINNNAWALLWLIATLMSIYSFFEAISRTFLNNPILILKHDKLYYLKTNQWYDITEFKFDDQYITKYNFGLTYCMSDKNDRRIISIKNWYLKNPEDFKSLVKYNRLLKLKDRNN